MKNPTDHDRLLDDVIEQATPPGFREQALGRTMAAVRWQRRRRQTVKLALPLAVVALTAVLWRASEQSSAPRQNAGRDGLSPSLIYNSVTPGFLSEPVLSTVTSQPLSPDQIITTDPGSVVLLSSAPGNISWVTDQPETSLVNILDDDGLLKLVEGRGAALVQVSPDQFTLVFANPADMKGFRMP